MNDLKSWIPIIGLYFLWKNPEGTNNFSCLYGYCTVTNKTITI